MLSRIPLRPGVTPVLGSGGKTTFLRVLGEALASRGSKVILCTTTRIFPFPGLEHLDPADPAQARAILAQSPLVCFGTPVPETGKLAAPRLPPETLAALADFVLVEADGSKRLPLKAHLPHEPVIPPRANAPICLVGLSGLGKPVRECAHRGERFAALAGCSLEDVVTPEHLARVLNKEALGSVYLLNQADALSDLSPARELAALLDSPSRILSLQQGRYYI